MSEVNDTEAERLAESRPARYSLTLALGAVGLLPATWVLLVGVAAALEAVGVVVPEAVGVVGASIVFLALVGSVVTVPVGLAALGSYRRQAPPSARRAMWTAVVLVLLAPLAWAAAALVWGLVQG